MCYALSMREIEAWYLIFGCRQEMEKHKQLLDKEYEQLLTQFSKVEIVNFNHQLKSTFLNDNLQPRKEMSARSQIMW